MQTTVKNNLKIMGFLVTLIALTGLVWLQQSNISSLDRKVEVLEKKISQISSIEERLKLEKDILGFEKDKTTIQSGAYTTLVQALGGLILSITAWVGYQNFKIGEKNLKVTEDKQVTERFSKSIEHLGNDKIDIRLGGIYALEQIMIDSPKYQQTIVEILSAFIREKCSIDDLEALTSSSKYQFGQEKKNSDKKNETPGIDIQAALSVIGARKIEQDSPGKKNRFETSQIAKNRNSWCKSQ